jgi:hypothetical protein
MSYFAKLISDYRPVNRPNGVEHKFTMIPAGTKVSVMEEYYSKDGALWCRLEPLPDYLTAADAGYPEPWVPRNMLTTMFGLELPETIPGTDVPATPAAVKANALEVAEAWKTAVYKTMLFLKVW